MTFAFKLTTHLNFFFNYFKVFFFATLKKQTICCVTTLPRFDPAPRNTSRCLRPNSTNASEVAVQRSHCSEKTFDRCTQWTSLDSRQDYLDFIGRPYNDEPSDITFVGQQYLDRNKIRLP